MDEPPHGANAPPDTRPRRQGGRSGWALHVEFAQVKFAVHAKICLLDPPHHPPLTPQENQIYRLGFPGWKLAERLGVPLVFGVRVHKDEAFGTYWAESNDMDGLVVSGTDLDDLQSEIMGAAEGLLSLSINSTRRPRVEANIMTNSPMLAVA